MATTDEEIAAKIAQAEDLRLQITETEQAASAVFHDSANDVHGAQLDAEIAELTAKLHGTEAAMNPDSIKAGASGSINLARQRLSDAVSMDSAQAAALAVTGEGSVGSSAPVVPPSPSARKAPVPVSDPSTASSTSTTTGA